MNRIILTVISLLVPITIYCQEFTIGIGDQAYDIIGMDQQGNEIKLSDYKNEKIILLNFTSTYCGPCWKTYDQLNGIQEKFDNELKVISFHWDNKKETWKKIAKKKNIQIRYTSIWDATDKTEIDEIYKVDGFPYFFVIDKNGTIVEKWFGNKEKKLNRILKRYIK